MRRLHEILACARQTRNWVPILLDYLKLRPLPYPYPLRFRNGDQLTLCEHTDTVIFWLIFSREHYPVAPSDRIILDVGANIGVFTLYAARQAPQSHIIAVEPFPDTVQRLEEMIERNQLHNRVTNMNCALTGKNGHQNMDSAVTIPSQYRRIHSPETASLNAAHRGPTASQPDLAGVPVRTADLATVLHDANVKVVDLLKMNIHGSEYDVLLSTDGAVLQRCRRIIVEYHEMPADMRLGKEQIFDRLRGLGFRLILDHDTHRGSGRAIFAMPARSTLTPSSATGH